ncbi:DUF1707 domain-containing protein [Aeromicrobium sp. 636]|uniref:DUF1707 domain-containing protein n=1 Tax=Aeromicrobium senzhongii TaxID=2663859 RepID=A0A8I0K1W4_9ACTN|nr:MULTISPECIES: DUF1707 domain-containing protein [Aeromicrobium]MBC9225414.1 DUF1707 domain-containing protein [Aeromicrobium senzhongii]MCQ3997524.1 DUF1707 domain-containing protein [Aeromicrobium sp. 636]MTB87450.1 DUF1707 domain-containing protein [Aeromicrobium senzhongii]QNL95496.1 DUF1707 domain-containing protein [Aeromicrobium senzhongii]
MAGLVRWDGFSADPRRTEVAGVRASDGDRETAVEALREAYADGRLDRTEFDRRSQAALSATLLGEFAPLLQDLEAPAPAALSVRDEAVRRYRRETRDARNAVLTVGTMTTGIWGATSVFNGDVYFFWPIFPILGVGVGWLMQVVNRGQRIEHHERRIARRLGRRRDADREDDGDA